MNKNTTTRSRRFSISAAAIATTVAVVFGAAACGTEKGSQGSEPPAPAPASKVQKGHGPVSADAAERQGHATHNGAPDTVRRGYKPAPGF
jgi:hypothetical protein